MLEVNRDYKLEKFLLSDISEQYMSWLVDPKVNKYLEVKFKDITLPEIEKWVGQFDDLNSYLWKIVHVPTQCVIGTATLYQIHHHHRYGYYGYLIGDSKHWGGTTAYSVVSQIFDFAFSELKLINMRAGAYANNVPAITNFLKLGMVKMGSWTQSLEIEGRFVDEVLYGISSNEWLSQRGIQKRAEMPTI